MYVARHRESAAVWVIVAVMSGSVAHAQLLLRDDFDGSGIVNPTVWRLPFGDSEGTFVGRTQFRGNAATDMPLQGVLEPLASDGRVMEIHLDTYSPIDPGNQFLGTDVLTKRNFARGGGLTFEARMRLAPPTAGGLVGALFLFDVTRESPPGTLVRDEIDFELLSNQATGAATHNPLTNVWNDGDFASPGNPQFVNVAGLDLTEFQTYKVEWTPQHVKWYVNNQLVRTVTSGVPDDPMKLHFNLWAPDTDFAAAFNAALQPAATAGANQRYTLQVDHVEVNRINTTVSNNLLTDGSFETNELVFIGDAPPTTTGQWLSFGNVFIEPDDIGGTNPAVPNQAVDGIFMLKSFGPFFGLPNASGVVQNVPAQPGEEFEARVWAQTASGDSIQGTSNFATMQISFLNSSGAVLETAPFVPVNAGVFPLLDGRDPNLLEDTWVEGVTSALAPAGTAFARLSLFFIQLQPEGGAVWFDNASLVRLTSDTVAIPGDFNGDGVVDAADYVWWRKNDPGNTTAYSQWRANFGVGSSLGSGAMASSVPEPGSCALVLACLLLLSAVRCRTA